MMFFFFVSQPFCAVTGYFTGRAVLQGQGLDAVHQTLRSNLWDTVRTSWMFWPAVNVLNFAAVPLEFRVLFANMASVVWTAHLTHRVHHHDHDNDLVSMLLANLSSRSPQPVSGGSQVLASSGVATSEEGCEELSS